MTSAKIPPWSLVGNFLASCNCDYFCPCVLSLGRARPTHGSCHGWMGFEVERGRFGDVSLDSLTAGLVLSTPGPMADGDWTVALYLDHRADSSQQQALGRIITGKAAGPIGWFDLVITRVFGPKAVPVRFEGDEEQRKLTIPGILETVVEAERGHDGMSLVRIVNSRYWVSNDVVVARTSSARYQDHGFNWRFKDTSGEVARFSWKGP